MTPELETGELVDDASEDEVLDAYRALRAKGDLSAAGDHEPAAFDAFRDAWRAEERAERAEVAAQSAVECLQDHDATCNPKRVGPELFSLGPEPEWLTCACGTLSARVPCFDCTIALEAKADRARALAEVTRTIPSEFRWASLSSPLLAKRVDAKRRPLAEVIERILGAHRVVLAGGSGAGKTSLAVACMRERLVAGARFVSAITLGTARIQHAAGDGEADIVERAIAAPLLLLDDLGEERHTATSAVGDVIRERHAAGRATWVTTGLRSRELTAKYGEGVRRRLFDGAYAEWLGPLITEKRP